MIRYLKVGGSGADMGWAIGNAWPGLVAEFVDGRLLLLSEELPDVGASRDTAWLAARGREMLQSTGESCPEAADELAAVAAASGVDPGLATVAAAYTDAYDLVAGQSKVGMAGAHGECSSFLIPAGRGGDPNVTQLPVAPIVGQTWDMPPRTIPYTVMIERHPPDAHPTVAITVATGLGYMGFSADGAVFVGTTNISTPEAHTQGAIFPAVVLSALQCGDPQSGAETILSMPSLSGHYYYLASTNGTAAVEVDGYRGVELQTTQPIVHTNHFHSPELRSGPPGLSSLRRQRALSDRLAALTQSTDAATAFRALLADHDVNLCRHSEKDPAGYESSTGAAIVFDARCQQVTTAIGSPCISSWTTVCLKKGQAA